ncbi:Heavy metal-associated domain containing protein [Musa troglodytarum]|uniref:Heavy metal-associated domain containing protein n=1 Tax=Musa troglodytarum TaxID=320322 RepID=A0A9E7HD86_9LILI|nr:Heavy metal-associated domain containing protein [Musa troglodytarum]
MLPSLLVPQTIELKVDMVALHEKRLRKCLSKVKGIERVEVEASIEKVAITGYANRNKVVKALRRVGLRAEFWSAHNEILSTYATGSVMFNTYSFF